jgi:hypothetical protein
MRYLEFERKVPEAIKSDLIWQWSVYRCALFLGELCWHDVSKLVNDPRTAHMTGRLYDAIGAIGADLAGAHARTPGKERAAILEKCLGSARQGRHWYYEGRHVLSTKVVDHRLHLLSLICRLVAGPVAISGTPILREPSPPYGSETLESRAALISSDWLEDAPVD